MEASSQVSPPLSAGTGTDAVGPGEIGAVPAPATRPGRPLRRLLGLAALTLTLGGAAFRFAYVNRPERCYRRALQAAARDDFDQVQYELLRLQVRPEYEPHAALLRSILLLEERKPDEAIEELRWAVDHPDTRALALTLVGRTLLRQRKFHSGERMLRFALKENPNLPEAHRYLGAAYLEVGDNRAALAHLLRAAELSPQDARPHRLMADIHQASHQSKEAIEDLRESLARDATGRERLSPILREQTLLDLAHLQVEQLHYEEALETLKQAKNTTDTLSLCAECRHALGELEAARDYVARALRSDPEHVGALLMQGRLALGANDLPAARKSLERALKLRPQEQAAHYLLAQVLSRLGRADQAEQHAMKAAEIDELREKYSRDYERLAREPRDPQACFLMGLMAQRLGHDDVAADWYRAVLLLDPSHAKARQQLSDLLGLSNESDPYQGTSRE